MFKMWVRGKYGAISLLLEKQVREKTDALFKMLPGTR